MKLLFFLEYKYDIIEKKIVFFKDDVKYKFFIKFTKMKKFFKDY
jgi:hypothetical protein